MNGTTVTPHLLVNDGETAIAFYKEAFGATLEDKVVGEDGKQLMHAALTVGSGTVFLMEEPAGNRDGTAAGTPTRLGAASCVIHLEVPDADAVWERARAAGAEVVKPLDNQFFGMRYGQIRDPFGHVWSIGGPVK